MEIEVGEVGEIPTLYRNREPVISGSRDTNKLLTADYGNNLDTQVHQLQLLPEQIFEQSQLPKFDWYELLSITPTESLELDEYGHSWLATVRDVQRRYWQELVRAYLGLQAYHLDQVYGVVQTFAPADQLQLLNLLRTAAGTSDKYLLQCHYQAAYAAEEYFTKQNMTFLGEKIVFPQLAEDFGDLAKYPLKQRYFDYTVSEQSIGELIAAAKRYILGKSAGSERDYAELVNLETLMNLTINPEIKVGAMLFEFSPPIYEYQSDVMMRVYTRTFNGWDVEMLAMPFESTGWPNPLHEAIAQLPEAEIITTANYFDERNQQLGTMVLLPSVEPDFWNALPGVVELGGIDIIKTTSQQAESTINNLQQYLQPISDELTGGAVTPFRLQELSERYQRIMMGLLLSQQDEHTLIESGFDQDMVQQFQQWRQDGGIDEWLWQVANSDEAEIFDEILTNYAPAGLDMESECGVASYKPSAPSVNNPINSSFLPGEQYRINQVGEKSVLNRCPICFQPNLVLGEGASCPHCHNSVSDIHEAFYCGKTPSGKSIEQLRRAYNIPSNIGAGKSQTGKTENSGFWDSFLHGIFDILFLGFL